MTQVPLRPWPGWLNLYRAWHLPNSADLQSADVARGAFLLMAQLADAREESLWWCSPQRVSVILLLSSHCGGSSTAVANDVHRGGFAFRHSAAALPSSYVIPLRRSSATGSRNRRTALYCRQADSVSADEKSDGLGRPSSTQRSEKLVRDGFCENGLTGGCRRDFRRSPSHKSPPRSRHVRRLLM